MGYNYLMDPKPHVSYVTLKIEPSARQAVARLAYALTGAASQRVNQTDAIRIGCEIALNHLDECATQITEQNRDDE